MKDETIRKIGYFVSSVMFTLIVIAIIMEITGHTIC